MDVEELRQHVEEEWERLDQEVIDNAISEWRKRLNLVNFAEFRVKQINFSWTSNDLTVIVKFRISQGSVAT